VVRVALPPPDPRRQLKPTHHVLPVGANLFRIYDPAASHGPRDARAFRTYGPYARFDHHRGTGRRELRGIWYAGLSLSCAVVEAFDIGVVEAGTKRLGRLQTTRALLLLDLRGRAAMRAGTVAALSAGDHALSQQWSRYFWEHPEIYGEIDGLFYHSAHNGEPAVALYERARDGLKLPRGQDAPLNDPVVLAAVRQTALDHGLVVLP
jgi:RES domain